ncbi:MAG TPA: esterase-like activity of phytase family protein [Phycisphaerales bacterium]|nr:esterase-like activity of phytase family protein [Phycisphaerales bacterium]
MQVPSTLPLVLLSLTIAAAPSAGQLSIEHAATRPLPNSAADQHGGTFTITGLSGVTWLGGNSYAAAMDNSNHLVLFEMSLGTDGTIDSLANIRGLTLSHSGDHEGIALASPDSVFVSDEAASTIREFTLADGSLLRTLTVPAIYSGRRGNLGLESLSFDPAFAWTANEEALTPDGPRATPESGTRVRLLRERTATDFALAQHAYIVEPMHGPIFPFGNPGQSGLADPVALPDGTLLALERSLAFADPFFLTRIYEVGFANASDVSGLDALHGAEFTPTGKTLLYQGGHSNLEGLCLGPRLTASTHALVGIVDDGDPISVNALVVFRLAGLAACPADVNNDAKIDIDDLHDLHQSPKDLDGDGAADSRDCDCLEAYLRRHEAFETAFGARP